MQSGPGWRGAITGMPAAMASSSTMPKGSLLDAISRASKAFMSSAARGVKPVKVTGRFALASSKRSRRAPSPTKAKWASLLPVRCQEQPERLQGQFRAFFVVQAPDHAKHQAFRRQAEGLAGGRAVEGVPGIEIQGVGPEQGAASGLLKLLGHAGGNAGKDHVVPGETLRPTPPTAPEEAVLVGYCDHAGSTLRAGSSYTSGSSRPAGSPQPAGWQQPASWQQLADSKLSGGQKGLVGSVTMAEHEAVAMVSGRDWRNRAARVAVSLRFSQLR